MDADTVFNLNQLLVKMYTYLCKIYIPKFRRSYSLILGSFERNMELKF